MAGFIPPDKLEQIRSASDIVDIIGAVLPLKRAGANFTALCPFHKEKSPSFNVNPHKQIFHCFGCHKGGDVFKFICEYENLSFVEAVKRLADRASIPLEFDNQPGQQQARHLKETLLQMHDQIAQRWQNALANDAAGQIARDYLTKRGVSEEAIKLFRLGYAPDAWDDTVNWAKSKDFPLPLVEQGGLVIRKEETDRYYDRFRGRLMFPICDEQGRVVAFSGRVLAGDEKTAKYVNSPETPIFTKGKVFFGLDKSKRAILDAGFAIICEGQLDLIACYMAGVKNIVAPQGTAFTGDHARILKRYVKEIVLCFDADRAGKNAAIKGLEGILNAAVYQRVSLAYEPGGAVARDALLTSQLSIRVAAIPAPHDPDSYIKEHGAEAFKGLIEKSESVFDFYLRLLCETNDLSRDSGKLEVARAMGQIVQKTGSQLLIDTYARKTALRLGFDADSMRAEFKKLQSGSKQGFIDEDRNSEPKPERDVTAISPPSDREFWLVRLLLSHDEIMDWVAANLDVSWIAHPIVRRVVEARLRAHSEGTWRGVPGLMDALDDVVANGLITAAVADGDLSGDVSRNLMETIRMLRNVAVDRRMAELKLRLAQPGVLESEAVAILHEQSELRRLKQQPLG